MFRFPRAVWLLGWVSLATDSATEAIYPILPFFLTRVLGASAVSLGVVEGAAEAVNSVLKIWSGRAADRAAADATTAPVPATAPSYVASGFSRTVEAGHLPREFTAFMIVLAIFTLGNSTDAFLLLKLTDIAGSARFVPLTWAALHLVKA